MSARTIRHLTFIADVLEGVLAEFCSYATIKPKRQKRTPRPIIHKTVIIKQGQ